jgi:hypothetical protein
MGIVNDQLSAVDEGQKLIDDSGEDRFIRQELLCYSVNLKRSLIDRSLGPNVLVIVSASQFSVDNFNAANLYNAMSLPDLKARRFGIKYNLSHVSPSQPRPWLGSPMHRLVHCPHGLCVL